MVFGNNVFTGLGLQSYGGWHLLALFFLEQFQLKTYHEMQNLEKNRVTKEAASKRLQKNVCAKMQCQKRTEFKLSKKKPA